MQTDTRALLHGGETEDELEDPEAGAVFEVDLDDVELEEADEALDEEQDEEAAELAIEEEELGEEALAEEEEGEEGQPAATAARAVAGDEDEDEDEAEETEADLDVILRERMGGGPAAEGEEVEEEEPEEDEAPTLLATATEEYRPRGADEFVCRSCFLVKDRRQLADPVNVLCIDCANGS